MRNQRQSLESRGGSLSVQPATQVPGANVRADASLMLNQFRADQTCILQRGKCQLSEGWDRPVTPSHKPKSSQHMTTGARTTGGLLPLTEYPLSHQKNTRKTPLKKEWHSSFFPSEVQTALEFILSRDRGDCELESRPGRMGKSGGVTGRAPHAPHHDK